MALLRALTTPYLVIKAAILAKLYQIMFTEVINEQLLIRQGLISNPLVKKKSVIKGKEENCIIKIIRSSNSFACCIDRMASLERNLQVMVKEKEEKDEK